jgi:hypothetical protein
MERWLPAYGWQGAAVGRRPALHSFLRNLLGNDLWNAFLAFRKGLFRRETVAALVDGHVVVTRLTGDRIVTDQGGAAGSV